MVGIEKSKEAVVSLAKLVSTVSDGVHNGGWLLKIYPLIMEVQKLAAVDLAALKAEALDLSKPEGQELQKAFNDNLNLVKKDVEVKVEAVIDVVKDAVELGSELVSVGQGYVVKVVALYNKAKALV